MSSHAESLDSFEELSSKYELLEELGGGGMGRVLHAQHRQLKQHVAIKLLQRDLANNEATTRFLREARAVAKIQSAHVARVMDAGVSSHGQPYIVMEYLLGRDLARIVEADGPLPPSVAVDYVLQALAAIAEAHSLGIIHRDLKPSNLFATQLAGDETLIKVLDFGLAKVELGFDTADPLTERGGVLGTPSYMAPEQFVDAQSADARSDLWSLGATLFQLISGAPPFRGSSLPQLYTAVMHGNIPRVRSLRPEICAELDAAIAQCLERDREQRFQSAAELANAIEPHGGPDAAGYVQRIARLSRTSTIRTKPISALEPPPTAAAPSAVVPVTARTPEPSSLRRHAGVALLVALLTSATLAMWIRKQRPSSQPGVASGATTARALLLQPSAAGQPAPATLPVGDSHAAAQSETPQPSAAKPAVRTGAPFSKHAKRLAHEPALSAARNPAPALYERYP